MKPLPIPLCILTAILPAAWVTVAFAQDTQPVRDRAMKRVASRPAYAGMTE